MRSQAILLIFALAARSDGGGQFDTITLKQSEVAVSARFNRLLLGSNISWTDGADGMFDPVSGQWRQRARRLLDSLPLHALRFPGGILAESYEWDLGVGKRIDRGRGLHLDGTSHRMVFGTDEFLSYCEGRGIEAILTVGMTVPSATSASRWVQYCNGSPFTPEGSRRSANGRALPYGVKFWELGNEIYLKDTTIRAARNYVEGANRIAAAMKKADSGIRLAANISGDVAAWDSVVVSSLAGEIDIVSQHIYYVSSDLRLTQVRQAILHVENSVRRGKLAMTRGGRALDLAITEYGVVPTDGITFRNRSPEYFQALFQAASLCIFARESIAIAAKWTAASPGDLYFADVMKSHTEEPRLAPSYLFQVSIGSRILDRQIRSWSSHSGAVYYLLTSDSVGARWNLLAANLSTDPHRLRVHGDSGMNVIRESIVTMDVSGPRTLAEPDLSREFVLPAFSMASISYLQRP